MLVNGSIVRGKVIDENDRAYYLGVEGQTLTLKKGDVEYKQGQELRGMAYIDQDQVWRFQTPAPDSQFDQYGWGQVVERQSGLGLFLDIGLDNKDVVLSADDLDGDMKNWPKKASYLWVSLEADKKNRLWARLAGPEKIESQARPAPDRLMNQSLECRVYWVLSEGVRLISKEGFLAFIHESEMDQPLALGQEVTGRVIQVHPDGRLNLSTQARSYERISGDAQLILKLLEKIPSHFLPLHDKSDPQAIRDQLNMSKGQFKRALGSLLKSGRVLQEPGLGIRLKEES